MEFEKFAARGMAAQSAVDEVLADTKRTEQRISFTVPASGRRYTIWFEDWQSICKHIEVAVAAQKRIEADD